MSRAHASPCHVQPQSHAVAVADVPLLLQVLRVRDAQAASARARRGAGAARPGRLAPPRQGAAGADGREARGQRRGRRAACRSTGIEDFTSYVVWVCERALERGLLPHTNLGVLGREDLARLREVTASQGLMLESVSERLMETVHAGSPTKHPARRIETIAAAGELKIPFTSGILVGIGETEDERMASLEKLAELHERHGHIQEVILQNFVPHQSYYGREPAQIADDAAARVLAHRAVGRPASRRAGVGVRGDGRGHEAADRRDAAADARRRDPGAAEPVGLVARARARRRHRPRRAERQRRPHLARAPVPVADRGPQAAAGRGRGAVRAAVRVSGVHRPGVDLAGRCWT